MKSRPILPDQTAPSLEALRRLSASWSPCAL